MGLLFCVGMLLFPWAAVRWSRNDAEQRRRTFSLSWKMGLAGAMGNIAQGYAFEHLHALAGALVAGGLPVAEVTFRTAAAVARTSTTICAGSPSTPTPPVTAVT